MTTTTEKPLLTQIDSHRCHLISILPVRWSQQFTTLAQTESARTCDCRYHGCYCHRRCCHRWWMWQQSVSETSKVIRGGRSSRFVDSTNSQLAVVVDENCYKYYITLDLGMCSCVRFAWIFLLKWIDIRHIWGKFDVFVCVCVYAWWRSIWHVAHLPHNIKCVWPRVYLSH